LPNLSRPKPGGRRIAACASDCEKGFEGQRLMFDPVRSAMEESA